MLSTLPSILIHLATPNTSGVVVSLMSLVADYIAQIELHIPTHRDQSYHNGQSVASLPL